MALGTNLKGRLRNTDLPKSHGLMPLFEAVVNSIESIEEDDHSSGHRPHRPPRRDPRTDGP